MEYSIYILQSALNDELKAHQQANEVLEGNEGIVHKYHDATIRAFVESRRLADERIPQLISAIEKITVGY